MNIDRALKQFRVELRDFEWPREVLTRLPRVTRRTSPDGEMNLVTAFDLTADNADHAIRNEVKFFAELGRSFEWKHFSFDKPSDMLERLQNAGFHLGAREALVVYDLDAGLTPFSAPSGYEVRRVQSLHELSEFRSVAEAVFSKDYSFTTNELAEAIRKGQRGHDGYVAYANGTPASIGRLYTNPNSEFAGLYGGGTLPEYRGQGFYRAIIAARARDASDRGCRYLQVDALPTSLPILLRLGFHHLADTWPCDKEPAAERP